jgi:hypothetical protein
VADRSFHERHPFTIIVTSISRPGQTRKLFPIGAKSAIYGGCRL